MPAMVKRGQCETEGKLSRFNPGTGPQAVLPVLLQHSHAPVLLASEQACDPIISDSSHLPSPHTCPRACLPYTGFPISTASSMVVILFPLNINQVSCFNFFTSNY